jgi:hypothetical protein
MNPLNVATAPPGPVTARSELRETVGIPSDRFELPGELVVLKRGIAGIRIVLAAVGETLWGEGNFGFNALSNQYGDLVEMGGR